MARVKKQMKTRCVESYGTVPTLTNPVFYSVRRPNHTLTREMHFHDISEYQWRQICKPVTTFSERI